MDAQLVSILKGIDLSDKISIMQNEGITSVQIAAALTDSHYAEMGFRIGDRIKFQQAIATPNIPKSTPAPSPSSQPTPVSNVQKCACNGCNKAKWQGFQHCGKTCASGACGHSPVPVPGPGPGTCICLGCNKAKWQGFQHCGKTCASGACGHSPVPIPGPFPQSITHISKGSSKWNEISQQFTSKWQKPSAVPSIISILEIGVKESARKSFKGYQQSKSSAPIFGNAAVGNTLRRFHGTKLNCQLGQSSVSICQSASCSVCRIIENGFLLSFQGSNTGFGRFGRGLYFTSASGKANDYTSGGSSVKAMFVALVVAGRGLKLYQDDTTLTAAPNGYDSVIGEVGGVLNYDEIVVYSDAAALPRYLILYN